jgi:hypothetical protein
MGCHTPDGRGEPGHVPSVRNTLIPLAGTPAGRRFLVQVPGSAQSTLSDAELAEVLNWMVENLSAQPERSGGNPEKRLRRDAGQPAERQVAPFTAAEVARYRYKPLVAVAAERQRLIADIGRAP